MQISSKLPLSSPKITAAKSWAEADRALGPWPVHGFQVDLQLVELVDGAEPRIRAMTR